MHAWIQWTAKGISAERHETSQGNLGAVSVGILAYITDLQDYIID